MFLDSKTEIIAHFIGVFEKVIEAARMRADYEEFAAVKAEMRDPGALLNVTINVTSPFAEGDFTPDLPAFLSPAAAAGRLPDVPMGLQPRLAEAAGLEPGFFTEPALTFGFPDAPPVMVLKFIIPPPSSAVTINIQNAFLWDEDTLTTADLGVEFTPLSVFHAALKALSSNAGGLQVLEVPPPPADGEAIALISGIIAAQVHDTEAPDDGDAVIYFAKGGDTAGITENGEAAELLPVFKDLLPDAHQEEEPEEEGSAESEVSEELVLTGGTASGEEGGDPQHELITGANLMANEAYVHVSWLDAPVITVMGDYLSVDAVSQVNVYNDVDAFEGGYTPAENAASTMALNAASITAEANPLTGPEEEDPEDEGAEEEAPGPGPSYVAVTRIDGDVVNMNYTIQYAFAYDNDVASVRFNAHETFIQMGGNSVFNLVGLNELGFQYDLIVIGGSMYDITMVVQTNILLDSDFLHLEAGFEGEVSTSDNLLMNRAELTTKGIDTLEEATEDHMAAADMLEAGAEDVPGALKSEEIFEDIEVLKVLYISGDLIDLQIVEQTNVLGDADQVAAAMDTVQCNMGGKAAVTAGSNAMLNNARLADNGIDSTVYAGGEGYSDALLYQAELVDYGNPLDVPKGPPADLASEAVVFLAEGMTGEKETGSDKALPKPDYGEAPADVMQSILA